MPEFSCVRCFSCSTFQVQQMRKNSKSFGCKVCGEKQSIQKIFHTSQSGKEIREVIQNLNMKRGHLEQERHEDSKNVIDRGRSEACTVVKKAVDWTKYATENEWNEALGDRESEDGQTKEEFTTCVPDKARGQQRKERKRAHIKACAPCSVTCPDGSKRKRTGDCSSVVQFSRELEREDYGEMEGNLIAGSKSLDDPTCLPVDGVQQRARGGADERNKVQASSKQQVENKKIRSGQNSQGVLKGPPEGRLGNRTKWNEFLDDDEEEEEEEKRELESSRDLYLQDGKSVFECEEGFVTTLD